MYSSQQSSLTKDLLIQQELTLINEWHSNHLTSFMTSIFIDIFTNSPQVLGFSYKQSFRAHFVDHSRLAFEIGFCACATAERSFVSILKSAYLRLNFLMIEVNCWWHWSPIQRMAVPRLSLVDEVAVAVHFSLWKYYSCVWAHARFGCFSWDWATTTGGQTAWAHHLFATWMNVKIRECSKF